MEQFEGRIAVVTGGGTGMGRELVRQLTAEGCHVSMCDVSADTMAETAELAAKEAPTGTRITTFEADVSDESQMTAFRDHVLAEHDTDHIHLLFNNAGVGGAGSFLTDDRAAWERTFDICWGGQAAMHHFHGVPKYELPEKMSVPLPGPTPLSSNHPGASVCMPRRKSM